MPARIELDWSALVEERLYRQAEVVEWEATSSLNPHSHSITKCMRMSIV